MNQATHLAKYIPPRGDSIEHDAKTDRWTARDADGATVGEVDRLSKAG